MVIPCPVCDAVIDIDEEETDEGDALTCDECGADLRVTSMDPLEVESAADDDEESDELDFAADDDEDDEDDDEEEDDETWK